MKTYYIEIDDCQNNTQAIIKVKASSENAAKTKALKTLHRDDEIFSIDKETAKEMAEDGYIIIDEDGEEICLEDEDDEEDEDY